MRLLFWKNGAPLALVFNRTMRLLQPDARTLDTARSEIRYETTLRALHGVAIASAPDVSSTAS